MQRENSHFSRWQKKLEVLLDAIMYLKYVFNKKSLVDSQYPKYKYYLLDMDIGYPILDIQYGIVMEYSNRRFFGHNSENSGVINGKP